METLINKANFCHDNKDEADKFEETVRKWYSSKEDKCALADGVKALTALADALSGKTVPQHETHGWKQAESAYEAIQRMMSDLKDANKATEKNLQEAYYNFILQMGSRSLASIHTKIIKECISGRDADMQEYVKTLPKVTLKPLVAICTRPLAGEPQAKQEQVYRLYAQCIKGLLKDLLEERGLVEEFPVEFFDLLMVVSASKLRGEGNEEFLKDCFRNSLGFFRAWPREDVKNKKPPFNEMLHKFEKGINNLPMMYLDGDYPYYIADAMKSMYAKNRQHSKQWLKLIGPLLKRPCANTLRAADIISYAANGLEWKGQSELAGEVFKAATAVKIPDYKDITNTKKKLEKRESFIEHLKCLLKSIMEGLKRAKLLTNFGAESLYICARYLQVASESEQLKRFVEELSETIVVNVKDPKGKKAVIDSMKTVLKICKNQDYPWVDDWLFQRAVKEVVRSCCRDIKDPRHLTDEDLSVFVSVCEECLRHDVLNPHTGEFSSSHYIIFMEIMQNLFTWLKTLDKFELAKGLIDPIFETFTTEEPLVFTLNSRYFGDLSEEPSGLKLFAPYMDRFLKLLVETENSDLARTLYQVYPANPKSIRNYMKPLMALFVDSNDDSVVQFLAMVFHQASKSVPEAFTAENAEQLIDKCASNLNQQSYILLILQELCKRRPEIMVTHADILMDKSKWNNMLKTWLYDMVTALALYDERVAPKALDYLLEAARTDQEKGNLLSSLNSARQIGFKYKELIKARRNKVEQLQVLDPDGQNMRQTILDMIDGKTSEEVMKQLEEQQADIVGLVGRVEETEEAVVEMKNDISQQGMDLDTVKKDVNEHGQRLDQVEETVEDTVAKVEEIDQKTLSHAPYWSRDVSKLLNPATDHDWKLLSSRLGYSNDDIRGWAQQADPGMAMLNEWYATRKTSEATLAVLTQLQEMNRQDAAIIVENAMKSAESVVEDEEFEYASPPPVFISYQWGHQPEARLLQKHLEMAGYQCWLDLGQMGGGDKLFEKIDSGIRAAKVVISCVTDKYAKSPNCNREVNLSVNLKKVMIPLLMEKCTWPPPGSMGPIFSEYLFIRFYQRAGEELPGDRYWPEDKFQELLMQLNAMGLPPDENQIEPVYRDWWMPKVQEIKIDKSKTKDGGIKSKQDITNEDKK
ncbi:hypothetical protein PoB_007275900, partial [Plakobranchus ocellatus]